MPQRQFWTNRHPCGIQWRYTIDPVRPDKPATFLVNVFDQEWGSMDSAEAFIGCNVVHEQTCDLLVATFEAYLFGEVGDVRTTTRSIQQKWLAEGLARQRLS